MFLPVVEARAEIVGDEIRKSCGSLSKWPLGKMGAIGSCCRRSYDIRAASAGIVAERYHAFGGAGRSVLAERCFLFSKQSVRACSV